MPVYLWHSEMDNLCPLNMGRYVAKAIPDCRAKFFPQEGHLSLILNHHEQLLSAMFAPAVAA